MGVLGGAAGVGGGRDEGHEVVKNWEVLEKQEREARGREKKKNLFE